MSTNDLKRNNLDQIIELRHYLHAHPDLSWHKSGTIVILQDIISKNTSLEIVDILISNTMKIA